MTTDEKAYLSKVDERISHLEKSRADTLTNLSFFQSITNRATMHVSDGESSTIIWLVQNLDTIDKEKWELELRKIEFRLNRSRGLQSR